MYAMNAIKQICKERGISARKIGREMGMGDNYVARIVNRGSTPQCDTMARMLDVCGYGLFAIPYEDVPESALQITATDD